MIHPNDCWFQVKPRKPRPPCHALSRAPESAVQSKERAHKNVNSVAQHPSKHASQQAVFTGKPLHFQSSRVTQGVHHRQRRCHHNTHPRIMAGGVPACDPAGPSRQQDRISTVGAVLQAEEPNEGARAPLPSASQVKAEGLELHSSYPSPWATSETCSSPTTGFLLGGPARAAPHTLIPTTPGHATCLRSR